MSGLERQRRLISPETRWLRLADPFALENGGRLSDVEVAYRTWGRLDENGGNAVVVCHALTGSADADDWWGGLFGPGRALDPERDFIVCSNILGGCYGTTGPLSIDPATGRPYGGTFPKVTIRDIVRLQRALLDSLDVRSVRLVLGPSLGGMQVLEWAAMYPEMVRAIAPIGVSARHSAWCIGISEAQRQAIYGDPKWQGGDYPHDDPPRAGLSAARMMAMLSYRSWDNVESRFGRETTDDGDFQVESYLRYQGEKLNERFDAASYVRLTQAMDSHDLARGRARTTHEVLQSMTMPALVVAVSSDVLYPPREQRELAAHLPASVYRELESPHGHDGFLIALDALNDMICEFRDGIEQAHPRAAAGAAG